MLARRNSLAINVALANSTGAYATGQQIGLPTKIKNGVDAQSSCATLQSIAVLDPSKSDKAIDFLFFSAQPTGVADKAAATLSAADLALCLGGISIVAGNYIDLSANSVATVNNLALKLQAGKGLTDLWVIAIARGTNTYAGANTLQVVLGLDRD